MSARRLTKALVAVAATLSTVSLVALPASAELAEATSGTLTARTAPAQVLDLTPWVFGQDPEPPCPHEESC